MALEQLGAPLAKIDALPFFVDLERRVSESESARARELRSRLRGQGRTVFLCIGRLIARKAFDDAIRAMAMVDGPAVLWIVGDGPERSRLSALTQELGVSERVELVGWLQPEEVSLALDACDVLVHPAVVDPFPTVVLDAMSRGRPVVGTAESGSVADRVVHDWNGYVCAARAPAALADCLTALASNQERLVLFGRRARETACQYPVSYGTALVTGAAKGKGSTSPGNWRMRYPMQRYDEVLAKDHHILNRS